MLRARTSFGLSVSTQLSLVVGTFAVLLLCLVTYAQRFAGEVTSTAADQALSGQLKIEASNLWMLSAIVGIVAVFLLCPLGFAVVRRFAVRLEDMTDKMLRISRNDTDVHVSYIHDEDELGDMARALHVFKANAISLLGQQEIIEQLNLRFDAALNHMARGLSMFDSDEKLVVCNKQFRKMYDLSNERCQPGVSLRDLIAMRASRERLGEEERSSYEEEWYARHRVMMSQRTRSDMTFKMSNGRTVLVTYEPMPDGGCVAIHEDITEKQRKEEKINRLACRDSLTGIANRYFFRKRLDHQFALCPEGQGFAVHMIDLDRFKDVNDTLGHAAGDVLLRLAAARIKNSMRDGDFVARLGGDEFAVIQVGCNKISDAMAAADRLIEILSAPYRVQGQSVLIGASIGVVSAPCDCESPDEVIKKADIALYRAKNEGRGVAVHFHLELEQALRLRRALEMDLRHAVREGHFELYYQPIVGLDGSRAVSCEALMRWHHPIRGWVPPQEFIPAAEDLGVIGILGEWALRTACKEASHWPDDVKVAVNLSPLQFKSCDLVEVTRSALESAGLAPERLELEVTESLLLMDDPETSAILHELRSLGVKCALDDFGTGYASLSYLLAFPFDKIKIDRMFVCDMIEKAGSGAIVSAIVKLAQELDIHTVAEGVETTTQLDEVSRLGCNEAQGYLFSRPLPADEIVALLSHRFAVADEAA